MEYSGAGGKLIYEKTGSKKSRDTVHLRGFFAASLCSSVVVPAYICEH